MLKVSFEKPRLEIAEEVASLFRKKKEKKDTPLKLWTRKERAFVGIFLVLSVLLSIYFWYKGQGRLPKMDWEAIGVNQKVILEK